MSPLIRNIPQMRRHESYARNLCSLARCRSKMNAESPGPVPPSPHVDKENIQSFHEIPAYIVLSLPVRVRSGESDVDKDYFSVQDTCMDNVNVNDDTVQCSLVSGYRENEIPEKASFCTFETSSCSTFSRSLRYEHGAVHQELQLPSIATLPISTNMTRPTTGDCCADNFDHESVSTLGENGDLHLDDTPRSIFSDFWDAERRKPTLRNSRRRLSRTTTAPSSLSSCMRPSGRRRAVSFSGETLSRPAMERRVHFDLKVSVRRYDRPGNNTLSCSTAGWSKVFLDSPSL